MIILGVKPAPFIQSLATFARIAGLTNADNIIGSILPSAASGQNMVGCQFIHTSAIDTNIPLLPLSDPLPNRA